VCRRNVSISLKLMPPLPSESHAAKLFRTADTVSSAVAFGRNEFVRRRNECCSRAGELAVSAVDVGEASVSNPSAPEGAGYRRLTIGGEGLRSTRGGGESEWSRVGEPCDAAIAMLEKLRLSSSMSTMHPGLV